MIVIWRGESNEKSARLEEFGRLMFVINKLPLKFLVDFNKL